MPKARQSGYIFEVTFFLFAHKYNVSSPTHDSIDDEYVFEYGNLRPCLMMNDRQDACFIGEAINGLI